MQWWAWIAGGALMLGAELTLVDAQFYLVLLGLSAVSTGLLCVALPGQPGWLQWIVFPLLALASMLGLRRRLHRWLRPDLPQIKTGPAGGTLLLAEDLPPGASCRIEYQGSSWSAVNGGAAVLMAGTHAEVERVEGLTLVLRPATP
jgi:membrane protein implicated in regulation of membrane protease activity